jgi:D-arabinan exo alpha-(1,3)/(1,5)-arabinofuranosidase (non-reducing end)
MLGPVLRGAGQYHIDYETYDVPPPDETLRFHAQWRAERPTVAVGPQPNVQLHEASNLDGTQNYVALDATGAGKMVGVHLQIHNIAGGWYGEGDDMVFVDGEVWPPSIHGTGTEEIFGGGACPAEEYAGTYHGFHLIESRDYSGLIGAYRWFVQDPIHFETSLRWTVEHGHANNFANEYASVAYWYQSEPHAPFPALADRPTMSPPLPPIFESAREALFTALARAMSDPASAEFQRIVQIGESFYAGRYQETLERLTNGHYGD